MESSASFESLVCEMPSMRVSYRVEVRSSAGQFEAYETRFRSKLVETLLRLIPAMHGMASQVPGHHSFTILQKPLHETLRERVVAKYRFDTRGVLEHREGAELPWTDPEGLVETLKALEEAFPIKQKKDKDDDEGEDEAPKAKDNKDAKDGNDSGKDATMKTQGPTGRDDGGVAPPPKGKEFYPPKNKKKKGKDDDDVIPGVDPGADGFGKVGQRISMPENPPTT